MAATGDVQELRRIIRGMLLRESSSERAIISEASVRDVDSNDVDATVDVKDTITVDGTTYQYSYVDTSGKKYVYYDNAEDKVLRLSKQEATIGTVKPATKKATAAKKGEGAKKGGAPAETGFRKLNAVIAEIAKKTGASPAQGKIFKIGSDTIKSEDIKSINPNDDTFTHSTLAYLNAVGFALADKLKPGDETASQKILGWFKDKFNTDASPENIKKFYNDLTWRDMLDKTGRGARLDAESRRYLDSLSLVSGVIDRTFPNGLADYLVRLAQATGDLRDDYSVPAASAAAPQPLTELLAKLYPRDRSEIEADSEFSGKARGLLFDNFILEIKDNLDQKIYVFENWSQQVKTVLEAALGEIKGSKKEEIISSFKGAKILDYQFSQNEQGLVDLLRFAYITTRAGGEDSGDDAAAKLGLSRDSKIKYVIPKDNIWYALGLTGAINSFPFMFIKNNTDIIYPANTRVKIGDVTSAEITSDLEKGIYLVVAIGLESGKSTQYDGKPVPAFIVGPDANRLLGMIDRSVEVSLIDANNKTLFSTRETLVPQLQIKIEPAPAAAPPAPATGAARPVPSLGPTTTLPNSITVSGKSPNVVRIENPYLVGSDVLMNNAGVVLSKKANRLRKRDRFTITVNAPNEFILVPVQIQQELREAAGGASASKMSHWVFGLGGGAGTAPTPTPASSAAAGTELTTGVYYLPLREISWAFEGNWLRYGTEAPRILPDTIRYELSPVAPSQLPTGVQTITPEQAISSGVIRGDAPDAISYAIISYLTDPGNPVGRTLYRQVPLNNAMNMFRQREIVS